MAYRSRRLAVVVPAYQEARLIGRTVSGIPEFVDRIIVVDDASRDRTGDEARRARAGVEVVRHEQNRGVGAAIATGYRRALENGPDGAAPVELIAVMAGDAQMDPGDLPRLCDPVVDGLADYAKGNRMRHPEVLRAMPTWRLAGGLALSYATRVCTGYGDLLDSQCGYTVLSAHAAAKLPLDELYPRYGYPNDLLSLCAQAQPRLRVVDVVVRPCYGDEESGVSLLTAGPLVFILLRALGRRIRAVAQGP